MQQAWFHGTRADLQTGDLIGTGYSSDCGAERVGAIGSQAFVLPSKRESVRYFSSVITGLVPVIHHLSRLQDWRERR